MNDRSGPKCDRVHPQANMVPWEETQEPPSVSRPTDSFTWMPANSQKIEDPAVWIQGIDQNELAQPKRHSEHSKI